MICQGCGMNVPNGTKFCPSCGAAMPATGSSFGQSVDRAVNSVNRSFSGAEQQLGSAFNDIRNSFSGGGGAPRGPRLKTDRNLLTYIVLTIVTCGIYGFWFIYTMAEDVNTACSGDGESTSGLIAYIVLNYITCGIYGYYWQYTLGNRLADNAYRYNMRFNENGTTVLLWDIFGALLCGIGPFIAINILIKNTNAICSAYNQANGYGA